VLQGALQCVVHTVKVYRGVLQCAALCCCALHVLLLHRVSQGARCCSILQYVAVCSNVFGGVAGCCRVL